MKKIKYISTYNLLNIPFLTPENKVRLYKIVLNKKIILNISNYRESMKLQYYCNPYTKRLFINLVLIEKL